jgi:periplasmic divalent cation tolerance protein
MTSSIIVFCTCPDEAAAERITTALVEEHLAACVNRIAGIASTYRWQGKVCRDNEQLLLIKTTRERFEALRERILALHPYELPEVIAVDISSGSAPYLDWIESETRG